MSKAKFNTLNVLQQQLFHYIKDYHPYLLENRDEAEEIIVTRAEMAQDAFSDAIMAGRNGLEASEIANEVLHAGLEFSPISYLQELYETRTGKYLHDEPACAVYRKTKEIFDRYGGDVEGSDKEDDLINELVPFLPE
ncbi:MAG: DUF1896 domain-containing protein [Dysgonamonadaceae bacterium]|jgi:hypothetical protein|nr:DUF1896 domain-containing protein [Dysgonamonadaceae bacterium]